MYARTNIFLDPLLAFHLWLFDFLATSPLYPSLFFSNIFSSTEIKVIPLLLSFIVLSLPPFRIDAIIPSLKCSGICSFSTILLSIWVSTVLHNYPLYFRFSRVMLSQPGAFLFFIVFRIVSISFTVIRPPGIVLSLGEQLYNSSTSVFTRLLNAES